MPSVSERPSYVAEMVPEVQKAHQKCEKIPEILQNRREKMRLFIGICNIVILPLALIFLILVAACIFIIK